jgi:TolB-like protein
LLSNKHSIAVLPFQNLSGDPEQEYFADGMVEEIITALSRFKSLFVIARNSSFTYKGKAVDIKQVGRELGVRYVLEGSVRKAGNRVRITGQLIEAATNRHLWADKFDGLFEDIFGLQDQVASSVVGLIAPQLEQAEIERSREKPTGRLDSYDLYLRGMEMLRSSSFHEARELFVEAFRQDPKYGKCIRDGCLDTCSPTGGGWRTAKCRNAGRRSSTRRCGLEIGKRRCPRASEMRPCAARLKPPSRASIK